MDFVEFRRCETLSINLDKVVLEFINRDHAQTIIITSITKKKKPNGNYFNFYPKIGAVSLDCFEAYEIYKQLIS